ncbi:MAG: thermonuclease family protein [Solirubrobacterales bacterium]
MGIRAPSPRCRVAAALCLLTAVGALVVAAALPSGSDGADRDCSDFTSQAQAQRFFASHHPGRDPHGLDGDGDGRACEELPCPCAGPGGGGHGGGGGHHGGGPSGRARVVSVADGDTIDVRIRHRSRSVRLIGIDTPEVYGHVECGGPQASRSMKRMLDRGDRVRLVRDRSQSGRDRYGRLLRYVERRGRDVGRRQVRRGWARVYVYDHPFRRVRSYRRVKRQAKRAHRGAWGRCGGRFRPIRPPRAGRPGRP